MAHGIAAVSRIGLCAAGKPWSVEANLPVLASLRATFGAQGLMFGSNFPVDGMFLSLDDLLTRLKRLVADWTPAEQRAFFHDTAMQVYRPQHSPDTIPGSLS